MTKQIYRKLLNRDMTEVIMTEGAEFVLADRASTYIFICNWCNDRIDTTYELGTFCKACSSPLHLIHKGSHDNTSEHKAEIMKDKW